MWLRVTLLWQYLCFHTWTRCYEYIFSHLIFFSGVGNIFSMFYYVPQLGIVSFPVFSFVFYLLTNHHMILPEPCPSQEPSYLSPVFLTPAVWLLSQASLYCHPVCHILFFHFLHSTELPSSILRKGTHELSHPCVFETPYSVFISYW